MNIILNKHTLQGSYIAYTLQNIRIEGNLIRYDESKFYSQFGNLEDATGKYFLIPPSPSGELLIEQHPTVGKKIVVRWTARTGLELHEIIEGERPDLSILDEDIEGDILIEIDIPAAGTSQEITVNYKEAIYAN